MALQVGINSLWHILRLSTGCEPDGEFVAEVEIVGNVELVGIEEEQVAHFFFHSKLRLGRFDEFVFGVEVTDGTDDT